ncbi:hypothetical protein J0A67_08050 [Algoriphagus aestuariicola]|uniref:Uncharacterized protein n=1 Tax=Algoriphagus aestuariicola TaxID=1852016 RepID=A0ABS3BNC3_9BACT|nr:hypothetical protein [Algoriphagus aestuariicola]MBN7800808.1 hypothetical protein [Algoriphagus aestuariicola]
MENASLEELKSLIEEELYLIPEDREAILAQLENSPAETAEVEKSVSMPAQTYQTESSAEANLPQTEAKASPPIELEELTVEPIPIRGDFSKGVLILHEEKELMPELMDMLTKMIKACGHSMSEVGMVSSAALENRSMAEFQNLNAHTVLKFGRIKHPVNGISSSRYEVFSDDETEYLFADSLSEISQDKNLKVKLWTSLQVLFNLSPSK